MKRLYVLTRNDLGLAYQAVQGAHAGIQFVVDHQDHEWNNGYLIFLAVKDLYELRKWDYKLRLKDDIQLSAFFEPDLENELTAIAVYCSGYAFRNLSVMGEEKFLGEESA